MLIKKYFVNINNKNIHCKLLTNNILNDNSIWLIMLHQGLGSIKQWKTFPERLFKSLNIHILLYDRIGYGESEGDKDILADNFLFNEAFNVLPQLIKHFKIDKYYLFGHSDGATISLLHASTKPIGLLGISALTPHVFVEEVTKQGIKQLISNYENGSLSFFLRKYHYEKTEVLFRRWTSLWLSEPLVSWNMFDELKKIEVPIQTIQGTKDEFGTIKQQEYIAKFCPCVSTHYIIENGKHNPHLEYPSIVIDKTKKAIGFLTDSFTE